ncbi:uroporphyrinogen-III synthase [Enterococcus sp. BWB1-3]|uniref:uroporphyrinogen-III synthase n=1 Tax=unclassified Enterococcus TaxID=2608891 RepID=UPI001924A1BE|nr:MULTISPECIES: uroporphyrinogen-III synthase [unclassified Enterococcus]MBL1228858.1 uroporphyrinogen-III synthase [Enterococcus sp. BWB1-3]MCB5951599.1 uroporphyrinogen-III synthase [Enterococcus sp. BWT-B8]MCB5954691.1 uroporphyrinogen-III synthase [Enterococcus sp. CWB-B31]
MRKILLTRLPEDNIDDKLYFQQQHYTCMEIPLMRLRPRLIEEKQIKKLIDAEWVFLTSQHSAAFFIKLLKEQKLLSVFQIKKFAVIGEKTANALREAGIEPVFQSIVQAKKSMFKQWIADCSEEPVKIVYPKSSLANAIGEELLLKDGHELFTFTLYDNVFSESARQQLKVYLDDPELSAVYFTSPSLWTRFYETCKEINFNRELHFYCVGQTTQAAIHKDGFNAEIR